jgi:hypothetical protein
MTALLHRLLTGHPHTRRIQVPPMARRRRRPPAGRAVWLAATAERLVTTRELDALRSLHPRRAMLTNGDLPVHPGRSAAAAES